ncbi:hypothetical protein E5Q_01747 [Mixia osmundae IAM 14324]|uniref:Uncharacterized protein n=1 Tax=Mixia osmundae (strain CBS 9802 / IAM 14324 / JCM 22182 / KY 12970) TaxID=764103 RepID=G7DWZ5_MIXOS|nr:hypothetical protein E5Q_01747 [Mixia osmundae IAM 14324]
MAALLRPIVNEIVARAVLDLNSITMSDPTDNGFTMTVAGKLSKTGPFPAGIKFNSSKAKSDDEIVMKMNWRGKTVANINRIDEKISLGVNRFAPTMFSLGPFKATFVDQKVGDEFIRSIMESGDVGKGRGGGIDLTLEGVIRVKSFGIKIPKVTMVKTVKLFGLNKLDGALQMSPSVSSKPSSKTNTLKVESFDIVEGTRNALICTAQIKLNNPQDLMSLNLGQLKMDVMIPSASSSKKGKLVDMGSLSMESALALKAGQENTISVKMTLDPMRIKKDGRKFVSDFINGLQPIVYAQAEDSKGWLPRVLGKYTIIASTPILSTLLVQSAAVDTSEDQDTGSADTHPASITLTLANPFSTAYTVTSFHGEATAFGIVIGKIDVAEDDTTVEGNGTEETPEYDIDIVREPKTLVKLLEAAAKAKRVSLSDVKDVLDRIAGRSSSTKSVSDKSRKQLQDVAKKCLGKLDCSFSVEVSESIGKYAMTVRLEQDKVPCTISTELINEILNEVIP